VELQEAADGLNTAGLARSRTESEAILGLLESIFHRAGAPIELDDLVDLALMLGKPGDQKPAGSAAVSGLTDRGSSMVTILEQRIYLGRLWTEIGDLPVRQRHALLLNLRDEQGRDLTTLLVNARIVTLSEVARVLGISNEEVAGLWSRLPLDDAMIAGRLGIDRQQVINLRTSARRRLLRRIKRLEEPP
jgi:hypothetical protein